MSAVTSFLSIMNESNVLSDVDSHRYFGYLPLAHILEFVGETYIFSSGIRIGFGTPFTMTDGGTAIKKGHKGDCSLLKPTIMAAVPMILDRIRKIMIDRLTKRGPLIEEIFNYAMAYKTRWLRRGFNTPIVNSIFCRNIKNYVGGQLKFLLVGGAPLSPDTQKMMKACLDVKLLQVWESLNLMFAQHLKIIK